MISTHSQDACAIFTYASGGFDRLLGVNSKVGAVASAAGASGVGGVGHDIGLVPMSVYLCSHRYSQFYLFQRSECKLKWRR